MAAITRVPTPCQSLCLGLHLPSSLRKLRLRVTPPEVTRKLVAEPGPKPMRYPLNPTAMSSRLPDQVHPAL